MYYLTVSADGKWVRSIGPVDAAQALKDWFDEESTGYKVTCRDSQSNPVTKAGLREVARHAQRA